MGIQDNQNQFAAVGSTAPAAAAAAPSMAPRTNLLSLLTDPNVGGLNRSNTSEVLAKAFAAVEANIKETRISSAYKVHGVQIDNAAERRLMLASIVLVIRHEASNTVAHHTLLLEASADPVPPKIEVISQIQVTIDRFSAQVYDQVYAAAVNNTVAAAFPNHTILNTGATVVPRIFDWTVPADTRALVYNAMLAAVTYLEAKQSDFMDMDMTKISNDANLQVQVSYGTQEARDYVGLPIRSDVTILTSAVASQRTDNGSLNNQIEAATITSVRGYIDLTYVGNTQQAQMNYGQQVMGAKRIYQPRLIITQMENFKRSTPAAQLLALATATTIGEGTSWYACFRPNQKLGAKNPHDIGAVNIEANLKNEGGAFGTKIDTLLNTFGDPELGGLMQAVCYPGLAISIDVNDCGSDTWYNRSLSAAAAGDENANAEILRAANTLTGGHFANLYGNNNFPAVLKTDERVFMGYWVNNEGKISDIRQVDYLTVLNKLAVTDPQQIVNWSDSFERVDQDQALRLQGRRTIIRSQCEQLVFTQYATRVTFNPAFLQMLIAALKLSNVSFKLINTGMAADYMSTRGSGMLGNAVNLPGMSGLFNPGGFSAAAVQPINRPFQGQSMV